MKRAVILEGVGVRDVYAGGFTRSYRSRGAPPIGATVGSVLWGRLFGGGQ